MYKILFKWYVALIYFKCISKVLESYNNCVVLSSNNFLFLRQVNCQRVLKRFKYLICCLPLIFSNFMLSSVIFMYKIMQVDKPCPKTLTHLYCFTFSQKLFVLGFLLPIEPLMKKILLYSIRIYRRLHTATYYTAMPLYCFHAGKKRVRRNWKDSTITLDVSW